MGAKYEMSAYFYSNVIWLESGYKMSPLDQIVKHVIKNFNYLECRWNNSTADCIFARKKKYFGCRIRQTIRSKRQNLCFVFKFPFLFLNCGAKMHYRFWLQSYHTAHLYNILFTDSSWLIVCWLIVPFFQKRNQF